MRVVSRIFAAAAALAMVVAMPMMAAFAQSAQTATGVGMADEAWFFQYRQPLEPVPDVDDPAGASGIPKATVRERTNPYPIETLHVGVNVGEPEARMFLGLPLFEFSETGLPVVVTGGKITLVDAGSGNGSRNVDGAEMVACLTTELVVAAQGGDWSDLPSYDCNVRAAVARVEGAEPATWTIDLTPFVPTWADPDRNYGIAVVEDPDSDAPRPQQTWHVAVQAEAYAPESGEEKRPVLADLRYRQQELPDSGFGDGGGFDGGGFDGSTGATNGGSSGGVGFGSDSGFGGDMAVEDPALDEDVAQEPAIGDEVVAAPPRTPTEESGIRTNPAVYLLPFLGLGLAGMLGYSLSHDPMLPSARQGAVSKLMARRRAGMR